VAADLKRQQQMLIDVPAHLREVHEDSGWDFAVRADRPARLQSESPS
jgi:hypothetical protein